ncbi:glycosyltransferase [Methanobrevibacter gottschalkii]|uniref:glycosyltransferase n=1 Tax=Methanobrevibacter gottschalkii TaxID=190974 RepID=UPI0038CFC47D
MVCFKKKFSIIIPFYNSENYLECFIDSVINQTLDFKENVEILLVNDGSEDNSERIALDYSKKFPDNIFILSQKHKGQSAAKNLALNNINGDFVIFLDSDDYLSKNTLKDVLLYFEKQNDLKIVAIPFCYFDRIENNTTFHSNRIINLDVEPKNFLLSCSQCIIRSDCLDNLRFNEKLAFSDETHFILMLLSKYKKFGVLNSAKYYYRKRTDLSSLSDEKLFSKNYFLNTLNEFHFDIINYFSSLNCDIPKFIQYALVHDLLNFIKLYEINILDDYEFKNISDKLHKIFEFIDIKVIANFNTDYLMKNYLYYLKFNKNIIFSEDNTIQLKIGNLNLIESDIYKLFINKVCIINSCLHIYGFLDSYLFNESISIDLIKYCNNDREIIHNIKDYSEVPKKFVYEGYPYRYPFEFKVPLLNYLEFDLNFELIYYKDGNKDNKKVENIILKKMKFEFSQFIKEDIENIENYDISIKDNLINVKKIFVFSIVMAMYNTGEYLNEAINSVINQSLDFENNVQLILVDDGSEDNSKEIALEYKKQFPNNILVISKKNGGQASARNFGMKYANCKYINFLDSDDYFSENTLYDILNFFKDHDEINVVSIPMIYFGRREQEHILNSKFYETRIINLNNEPNNPLLSCSSSFFKKSSLKNQIFDTKMTNLEDALFVNKILLDDKKYGVVNSSKYYYRKRFDASSTTDTSGIESINFIDRLKQFHLNLINLSISKNGIVEKFIKYLLIYDLQWMIDAPELNLDESRTKEFWYYFNQVIDYIPIMYIMNNKFISDYKKLFLAHLKDKDLHFEYSNNSVSLKIKKRLLDNVELHKLWLDIVEIDEGYLKISGFFNSHFDNNFISIEAIKEYYNGNSESFVGHRVNYSTSRKEFKFLSIVWGFKYSFDIKIPIVNSEGFYVKLKVNFHKDRNNSNFEHDNLISFFLPIELLNHVKLSKFSNYAIYDNFIIKFNNDTFNVVPYSNKTVIQLESVILKKLIFEFYYKKDFVFIKLMIIRFICIFIIMLKLKRNPIYLFMDRVDKAEDNGEALFKYSLSLNDNVKKYFILKKGSDDFTRISKLGKVLSYKSNKHRLLYLLADKIIVAHPDEYIINPFFNLGENKFIGGLNTAKIYFLQHGVTFNNVSFWLHKFDMNLKLVVSVSNDEKNSFIKGEYGYDDTIVHTLGFPRFDNLENTAKKQILLMPTWRNYLEVNKETFINSDYYTHINNVLNNEQFINCCKEYGYDIIFKPHPRLSGFIPGTDEKYIDLFNIDPFIKLSKDTYQEVFNNSSLLITDYSSVHFDFAYLKKPIIYYQPDDYHHTKDYFDLEKMGFGEIIKSENYLINKIKEYLSNNCKMESYYRNRVEKFFKYIDQNNSKRVYDWIKLH